MSNEPKHEIGGMVRVSGKWLEVEYSNAEWVGIRATTGNRDIWMTLPLELIESYEPPKPRVYEWLTREDFKSLLTPRPHMLKWLNQILSERYGEPPAKREPHNPPERGTQ